jgi:tetratricopeptide (TPR) repeat protein
LHEGDREAYPDAHQISRWTKKHAVFASWVDAHGGAQVLAEGIQSAWRAFHAGEFLRAMEIGAKTGALGATAANKAAAIHTLYEARAEAGSTKLLQTAAKRAEQAVKMLPDYPNAHYTLALTQGRYSQRISIVQALANGLASRVRTALDTTLKLEPRHAEAHIALGLFHAEILAKLGSLVARFSYQVSAEAAIEHFRRAIKLAPKAPIAYMEYAHGLLLLNPVAHREQARELYAKAAACEPIDATERLDVERAKRGLP